MKRYFPYGVGILLGIAIGVFAAWMDITIKDKNEEIASLQEKLSQEQSDRLKDILRFGQWKLQVEQLAKENGWILPEMLDSLVFMVDGPVFEGRISAEKTGDSVHIVDKSVKIIDNKDSCKTE